MLKSSRLPILKGLPGIKENRETNKQVHMVIDLYGKVPVDLVRFLKASMPFSP